jgi:signal transduction histidine kinase
MDWRDSLSKIRTLFPDGRPVPREELMISRAFKGEHPQPRELVLEAPDGTRRRSVLSLASPLSSEGGRVRKVVTGFSDVSALRELADAKDRFLRIASHELRSPITSLRATTSLLEIDPTATTDPERRNVMLQRIQRQIDRLVKLVEQLIDSARLGRGDVPIQPADCDLVEIAREAIELARSSAPSRVVRLESPPSLHGRWDALRVEQVVANLVANAIRYSPPDSDVEVRVSESGDARVRIEVRDHGIGIPPEQLGQVFSPFFRAANAQHQHKGGLGLGLYIAAESVRRHGGTIQVDSRLGQGTTFTVELPR